MKFRVGAALLLIGALSICGCGGKIEITIGPKSDKHSEADAGTAGSGQQNGSDALQGLAEEGLGRLGQLAEQVGADKLSDQALKAAEQQLGGTWEHVRSEYADDARALLNQGGNSFDQGLRALNEDPENAPEWAKSARTFAVSKVPVLRALRRYGKAREDYRAALKLADDEPREAAIHAAKRECLLACIEAGIDVTVLGTGGMTDAAARNANEVLGLLKKLQLAGKLGGNAAFLSSYIGPQYTDQLGLFLDAALEVPAINLAMHEMLRADLEHLGDNVVGSPK